MAIFSLNHKTVGRSTHAPGTAGARIRYITRENACSMILGNRMPTEPHAARAWMDRQENRDRINARVCDTVMVALPLELSEDQRAALVRDFAETITKGRAPWIAGVHQEKGVDDDNPHAHIVIRDRDPDTGKRVIGMSESGSTEMLRETWERICNEHLERAGSDARVDRRSLEDQGIDREPEIHVGANARELERMGERPESKPINEPAYKKRPAREVDYPDIDQGKTRAQANYERKARNKTREKLKPLPVDSAEDRPIPESQEAKVLAVVVEEKKRDEAREAIGVSAQLGQEWRGESRVAEGRFNPRSEDKEREGAPTQGGRATGAGAGAGERSGVDASRGVDAVAGGIGKAVDVVADSLWSLVDGGAKNEEEQAREAKSGPMSKPAKPSPGQAWAQAAQDRAAAAQRLEQERTSQARQVAEQTRHRGASADERAVIQNGKLGERDR